LSITSADLASRLFLILAGSAAAGIIIRKVAGSAAIERNNEAINGFNIVVLFFFVAAVMESVGFKILADPATTFRFMIIAFAVFFAVMALSSPVFLFAGRKRALSIGLMVSQRNMALMLAATGSTLPDLAWLYFAFAQFPLFLSPQLLTPLIRRLLKDNSH
jgi:BASS family bile acid:Na+ symporter